MDAPLGAPLVILWVSFLDVPLVPPLVSLWCLFGDPLGVLLDAPLGVLWCPLGCRRWGFPGWAQRKPWAALPQRSAGSSGGGGGSPSSTPPPGAARSRVQRCPAPAGGAEPFAGCGRAALSCRMPPRSPFCSLPQAPGRCTTSWSAFGSVPPWPRRNSSPNTTRIRGAQTPQRSQPPPNPKSHCAAPLWGSQCTPKLPPLEALLFAELNPRTFVGFLHPAPVSPGGGTGMQCGSCCGSIPALLLESKTEIKAVNQKSSACRPRSRTSPVISSLIRLSSRESGFLLADCPR